MTNSANRVVALVVGLAFLALGAVGVVLSWCLGWTDPAGVELLGILSLNPLLAVIHLALGVTLLVASWRGRTASRLLNRVVGTLALALGLAGLFLSSTPENLVAVNGASNLAHFIAATVLLAVGLGTDASGSPGHPARD